MIWLLAVAVVLVLVYEVWATAECRTTISQYCWRLSAKYPPLPFAAGFLMGHLFWKG